MMLSYIKRNKKDSRVKTNEARVRFLIEAEKYRKTQLEKDKKNSRRTE